MSDELKPLTNYKDHSTIHQTGDRDYFGDEDTNEKAIGRSEEQTSVCNHCFEIIWTPYPTGLWKHMDNYYGVCNDPTPANITIQLLLKLTHQFPFNEHSHSWDTCKKHEKLWNNVMGYKKTKKGWIKLRNKFHLVKPNWETNCGKVLTLRDRQLTKRNFSLKLKVFSLHEGMAHYVNSTCTACLNYMKKNKLFTKEELLVLKSDKNARKKWWYKT